MSALGPQQYDDARYGAFAPTFQQAKQIYWKDLQALLPKEFVEKTSNSELIITLVNGAEIVVAGLDKPQRIEGRPWDGVVLDEYGNMKNTAWPENVYPALSDRNGWAWLIGVPEGRNHYYELTIKTKGDPEWDLFTWKSSDILPPSVIEAARRMMDPLTFQQEYEASFVTFEGRAYYTFDVANNTAPVRALYNNYNDLMFCFDFNVDPGVAAVVQEHNIKNKLIIPSQTLVFGNRPLLAQTNAEFVQTTCVIGEVFIDRNSNTEAVCRKLIADWGDHKGRVLLYGDATGGNRGSAKLQGSDWDIVWLNLKPVFGDRLHKRVPRGNPTERSRINAMNTRSRTGDGTVRLLVDPTAAPKVVRDLEGVRLLKGGSGEIDKKHDKELSHISDALGYYVVKEFPVADAPKTRIQQGVL